MSAFPALTDITIGDTVTRPADASEAARALSRYSEPTVEMTFSVNDSARLPAKRENLSPPASCATACSAEAAQGRFPARGGRRYHRLPSVWLGRGEMHLSILDRNHAPRRAMNFPVSTPKVLYKEIDGKTYEPIERLLIDVPEESVGTIMQKMSAAQGGNDADASAGQPDAPGIPRSPPAAFWDTATSF